MKETKKKKFINYCGITLIILAIVLFIMTRKYNGFEAIKYPTLSNNSEFNLDLKELTELQHKYFDYRERMVELESSVAESDNKGFMILIILLLFASKSVIAIVPISATCLLSGALVLPLPLAILVNFIGISILMSIKYFWGKKFGGGNISRFLKRYPNIVDYLEHNGSGNPWILFLFRLVPSFPVNPISQIYGNMKFNFKKYLLISLAGFSIKIFAFTLIGSNVYDPLSNKFIVPIIIILFISGFSMLIVNAIISITTKNENKKNVDKLIIDKKSKKQ